MAEICLRWALLIVSWWGYYRLIARWGKLRSECAPFVLFGVQTLVVYLAGVSALPGAMPFVSAAMLWGGVVSLGISFLPKFRPAGHRASPWLLLFAALAAWGAYALYGQVLLHFDNFTHWGVIVKLLLQNDRLPDGADALLRFQSYPPGSACFAYYVCRATSSAEWCGLMAQALLVFSCVPTLGSFVAKRDGFSAAIVALFAFVCIAFLFQIYDLLVDNLLAVYALATTALLFSGSKEGGLPPAFPVAVSLSVLALLKNSGLFLAVFILLYAVAVLRRRKGFGVWFLICAGVPALLFAIWRVHVTLAFPEGLVTKHAMSVSNYARMLEYKTWEGTLRVFVKFAGRTLRKLRVLAVLLAALAAFEYARRRKMSLPPMIRFLPVYMLGCYALYMVGMLAMYITSMPEGEALILGGYDRYHETIELYLVGMAAIYAVCWCAAFPSCRGRAVRRTASCIALGCMVLWCAFADCSPARLVRRTVSEADDRVRLETLISELDEGFDGSLLVCHTQGQSSFWSSCGRYLLGRTDVQAQLEPETGWLEENARAYDAILILDPCEGAIGFLAAHGLDEDTRAVDLREIAFAESGREP